METEFSFMEEEGPQKGVAADHKVHILIARLQIEGAPSHNNTKDPEIHALEQFFHSIVVSSIHLYHGTIADTLSNAYLATFKAALDVLRAGAKIQSHIVRQNEKENWRKIQVK